MISGVCGGIARYFGVDSTVVRIAAVVLALFGGAGALLYVAALLLMPSDDPSATQAGGNRTLTIVGVSLLLLVSAPFILGGGFLAAGLAVPLAMLALAGLLVWWLVSGEGPGGSGRDIARRAALGVGVLVLCGVIAAAGALAAGLGGGTVAAALVIAAGAMLIIGAFFGGVRWLIPPALSLALAVGFVSAAGIDLEGGVGERDYRPTSASELRDNYRVGMGQLTLDLRDAKLPSGDTHVNLDVGMGEARLIVPEDVCVASAADIGMGGVDVLGRDNGGIDVDWDDNPRAARGNSRVIVNADIGVGALVVRHDRADEDDHGPPFSSDRRFGGRFAEEGDLVGNVGCQRTRAAR
jgi:phage shock protein PspC (stress-responsive transcriptional regulator)